MSSKPYYGPDESASTILLERTFLSGDFVCGTGYGLQFALYVYCATFLWKVRHSRGHRSLFLLAYITLLLCIQTIFGIAQARIIQMIYIDNRNFPGGPWAYFLSDQNYLPINVIFYATLSVLTFLADLLVLWRCWVIWSSSGKLLAYTAIALPALMILASFALGTLWTLQSSQSGLSGLYGRLSEAYGISYYIISLSVNILLTILITIRLLLYRRRIIATLPTQHGKHYLSLATIMIESAALYFVFAVPFVITYALNNGAINQIFLAISPSAQQIASYLIIYRVANGRAWNQDTQDHLQTLQFKTTTNQIETSPEALLSPA